MHQRFRRGRVGRARAAAQADRDTLHGPTSRPLRGPVTVIGPGHRPGRRAAGRQRATHGWHAVETEGGHVSFAPIGDEEQRDRALAHRAAWAQLQRTRAVRRGPRRKSTRCCAAPAVRTSIDRRSSLLKLARAGRDRRRRAGRPRRRRASRARALLRGARQRGRRCGADPRRAHGGDRRRHRAALHPVPAQQRVPRTLPRQGPLRRLPGIGSPIHVITHPQPGPARRGDGLAGVRGSSDA